MDHGKSREDPESYERPESQRQEIKSWGQRLRYRWLKRFPIDVPQEGFARAAILVFLVLLLIWFGMAIYRGFGGYAEFLQRMANPEQQ